MNTTEEKQSRLTVVYTRQSRPSQLAFSSCDSQYSICKDTADSFSWPVHDHFADGGESSETLERPALEEMIGGITKGLIGRVIVDRVDRLARRLVLLNELFALFDEFDVELVVVTEPEFGQSAASRLMTNIVAAASEFQQDMNRDRLADMRAAMKRKGKRVAGQIPFGYTTDSGQSKLIPDPDNSVVIRDIFALAASGSRPSDIAVLANLSKWKDRYGNEGRWTSTRILKLLSNRTYVGEIPNGDSYLPGEHAPLVARDVFDRVQEQIANRQTRKPGRRKRQNKLALIDVLVCGLCERPMTSSYSRRGNIRYVYYRCRSQAGGRPPCANVNVRAYDLERFVCQTLSEPAKGDLDFLGGFSDYWNELSEMEQLKLLSSLVTKVVFDPVAETIDMEFNQDEIKRLLDQSSFEDPLQ
ncbi:MAG: recombinase family protein [Pirellulaceae bacterium]